MEKEYKDIFELAEFVLEKCYDITEYHLSETGGLTVYRFNSIIPIFYLDTLLKKQFPTFGGLSSLVLETPYPGCHDEIKCEIEKGYLSQMTDLMSLQIFYTDYVPDLPPNLISLFLSNNRELSELPDLPDSLVTLKIDYTDIENLPNLPLQLKYISFNGTPMSEKVETEKIRDRADIVKLWNYLNNDRLTEALEEKDFQIFFMQPKDTFKTDIEEKCIDLIDLYFDSPYIENTGKLQDYSEVNTLVVLPFSNNRISKNMLADIKYAFSKNMEVYWISPEKYKIFKKDTIDFFSQRVEETENKIEDYFYGI